MSAFTFTGEFAGYIRLISGKRRMILRTLDQELVLKVPRELRQELDGVLRNLGVTTIVGVGVSVNVAIPNLTMDAVNAAYNVVLPRDAIAGIPREYAEAVLRYTLSLLATITTTDALIDAWS